MRGADVRTFGEFVQACYDVSLQYNLSQTSGWRTPVHNGLVGGSANSKHLPENGWAMDLVPDPPKGETTLTYEARMELFLAGPLVVTAFRRRGIVCVVEDDHFHVQFPPAGRTVNGK